MFSNSCILARNPDRFRNARYDFVEPAASPASKKKNAGKVSRKDRGTHEPIEDMPSTLELLMKVRRVSFFVVCRPSRFGIYWIGPIFVWRATLIVT